jgi:calcium permeable stress-gated cation channel
LSASSPQLFIIVSGVLPPAVSGLFAFFLPIVMRWLSQFMGALTGSYLDRAVVARYFSFLVISQLVIFTLIGVAFSELAVLAFHFSWLPASVDKCRVVGTKDIVTQIGQHASFWEIIHHLDC